MIVTAEGGGQAAALSQLRPMGSDPGDRRCAQGLGLRYALGECGSRNRVTGVFDEVSQSAQCVESNDGPCIYPKREPQGIDRRLMMAGPAGQRAVAVRVQGRIGEHADRPVGAGESRLGAYRRRPGITDLALGAGEKAPDRLPGRRDGFEGHSDQAFQAHARCR